jgi:tetratricopeptide (TPR) repeat protein
LPDAVGRRTEAHALYLLAEIFRKRGDLEQAIEAAQHAVTLYLLAADMWGQSQALNTLASAHQFMGNLAQATDYFQQGLRIKEQIGDVAGQAMITLNLGEIYRTKGELAAARQMQTQSLRIWRDLRNLYAVALLHNNLAATAIMEDKWEEAAEHLVESEKLFDTIGSKDFEAELHRHRAELNLGRGQMAAALAWAQQAVSDSGDEKLEVSLSRRVLGQVYLAQDNLADAERELQASLDILESIGSSLEAANTRLVLAQVRWRQGQSELARRLVAAAIETYESVGAEALIARAQGSSK